MNTLLVRFLAVVLGLFIAAHVVPGVTLSGLYAASIVAILLGALNLVVRPVLVFLTLPITIVTMGLFIFVINAVLFMLVGTIAKGFEVQGFLSALFGSLIVSAVSFIAHKLT